MNLDYSPVHRRERPAGRRDRHRRRDDRARAGGAPHAPRRARAASASMFEQSPASSASLTGPTTSSSSSTTPTARDSARRDLVGKRSARRSGARGPGFLRAARPRLCSGRDLSGDGASYRCSARLEGPTRPATSTSSTSRSATTPAPSPAFSSTATTSPTRARPRPARRAGPAHRQVARPRRSGGHRLRGRRDPR